MKMNWPALFLVMTAGVMWAGSGLFAQDFFTKSSFDSMDLTVFRMFGAGCLMLGITAVKKKLRESFRQMRKKPSLWVGIIFYGIVGLMLMHYTYFASIAAGNAATATVIQYTCPAMVVLWMAFTQRKLPTKRAALSVIFAVAGVFLLVTEGDPEKLAVPEDCIFFGLLSAVFFAVCCVYPKRFIGVLDNSFVLSMGMFSGMAAAFAVDPLTDISGFFDPAVLLNVFWIVICGTAIAFTCYNTGLKYLSEEQAAITAAVEPVVSVAASCIFLGNSFGWIQGVGILLVIAGIILPAAERTEEKSS